MVEMEIQLTQTGVLSSQLNVRIVSLLLLLLNSSVSSPSVLVAVRDTQSAAIVASEH